MSEECSKTAAFRRSWNTMVSNRKARRQRWGLDKKNSNASIYNDSIVKQLVQTNQMLTTTLCNFMKNDSIFSTK